MAVVDTVEVAGRRQPNADMRGRPSCDHRLGCLKHEPRPIFDGSAVGVRTFVAAILQKLILQVAVGAVQFDAVKPASRAFRVAGRRPRRLVQSRQCEAHAAPESRRGRLAGRNPRGRYR